MDVDELQHALGGVVLESAFLERVLDLAEDQLRQELGRDVGADYRGQRPDE
jgi:hypothetical protein